MTIQAWTDYPVAALGDRPGVEAPVRACELVSYDRNKYVVIRVGAVQLSVKRGYLYTLGGRCGDVPTVPVAVLEALPLTIGSPVTAWYVTVSGKPETFNHLESGWSERDLPHARTEGQRKAWAHHGWRREHQRLAADGVLQPE